jgi:hypothetical protein
VGVGTTGGEVAGTSGGEVLETNDSVDRRGMKNNLMLLHICITKCNTA